MAKTTTTSVMDTLLENGPTILRIRPGELLEGTVVFKGKNKLLIDIGGVATGIISGRELRDSFNTFKELTIGSSVMAMVLEEENNEGMHVLSLRMASQQKAWEQFHRLIEEGGTMKFVAQEANKGGLLSNIDGIRTFLPVSQLAPAHYPRVNNADQSEIINRLLKYVNFTFTVKIITMDEEAGKIVVSEREALSEKRANSLESLKIGDTKDGMVTGVVKFGLFVAFDGLEGLVHISEIAWGHVKNPSEHAVVGDKVKVKIIGIDGDKLSLSMKQLTRDPWEEIAERYPVGKKVTGTVVRFADYGAFLKLEKDINGLIHLTEVSHLKADDPSEVLTIGQKVDAQVINIDIDERRIGLSLKALQPIDKETLEKLKAEQAKKEEEAAKEVEKKEKKVAKKKTEDKKEEKTEEKEEKSEKSEPKTEGGFVASKSGKKFYSVESAQGKKIKEENRVYFATEEEAEKAGLSK
ncbi:S1 RNA-binding domain-containing protein [Candidatus Peregrinibacteria bacterium]|jgi:small subunit ribosomal protein S1|nr:S1 RNA-binding domain-containing protein [Candidatus Peregrinibacteria bacterium]MBT3598607.1 S1 RNA-binding domain-containing protein [Candidatus Peregrinibacteria bacterium]MBT4367022.1 S1 RNA-binding domain-containing protein [Candidatus Peregrinibacteria bacterium]MBT4586127.1 S1 RNA-binding domain-containing protein [Candidatus Peregrinibacteria bacterium]MBT6730602.1 S1 RNA-binding domain-containing protein [Candidatus Peregrinibacteria bacterium]